jgi:two-component system chemotaxis sensor kinase CheA
LDTSYWLMQAWQDWFNGTQKPEGSRPSRVLVVEDNDFFRQLILPTLSAAGFKVSSTGSATEALRMREAGVMFDAIVSDIEMPEMDGLAFAQAVRAGGAWANLPMIALTAHTEPRQVEAGRDAGFTDYVAKFQRDALVASLRECLTEPVGA